MGAYLYSARVKGLLMMDLMLVVFFKTDIPVIKPGEKPIHAPTMIVQGIDGKSLDLQQQKGKVVFINFWATWCPPCLGELPSVNDLYLKVKDNPNIVFRTVDVDGNLARSSLFLQKKGYRFRGYSRQNELPPAFFSGTIPTTLVIDKKGDVVFNHIDRANYNDDEFTRYLISLSKE